MTDGRWQPHTRSDTRNHKTRHPANRAATLPERTSLGLASRLLHIPISPHISPYLPTGHDVVAQRLLHISPYLPISPRLSPQATTSSLNDFFIGLVKVVGGVTLMFIAVRWPRAPIATLSSHTPAVNRFIVSWQMTLITFLSLLGWLVLVCLPGMRRVSRLTISANLG